MTTVPNFARTKNIHMIGIGGAGMGGIAEVLLNKGYTVTGSDVGENEVTRRLQEMGATVTIGHNAENIKNANVVVVSSAITKDNPEIVAARKKRIPVIARAQMLGELMRVHEGIAVAGTHGKTTTTSLITSIFSEAGLEPTFVIGGLLNSAGVNAQLGSGKYFIAEADESDASFLYLRPKMSVVTNIDADHMQTYNNDLDSLRQAFLSFLEHLPLSGLAVVCVDDPEVRSLLPKIARPVVTYGFSEDADLCATEFKQEGLNSRFEATWRGKKYSFTVNMPGVHNVLNALAAIAIAFECDIPVAKIQAALSSFQGVGRRFELYENLVSNGRNFSIINDYGHHPNEIAATISAVRGVWPGRRLVLAFQPHRYTRTRDLFSEFTKVLGVADYLLLLDIYPASEQPIVGISGEALANSIKEKGDTKMNFIKEIEDLPHVLDEIIRDDDIVLMQGAGTIGKLALDLVARYR